MLIADSVDKLQMADYKLYIIAQHFGLQISAAKTNVLEFRESFQVAIKVVSWNKALEQASSFSYLRYEITYAVIKDVENNINRFKYMCGTTVRNLRDVSKE